MRLYRALCAWLEAQAAMMADDDQHPEGNNFTDAQVSTPLPTRPELHIGYGRQSGDDDGGGVYRATRPISMRWQP